MLGGDYDAENYNKLMEVKKIINIHTDSKFIHGSEMFDIEEITENVIIYVGKRNDLGSSEEISVVEDSMFGINECLSICKDADIVVVWGLSTFHRYVLSKLPQNIIIIWRLLGYEFYSKHIFDFVSEKTKEVLLSANNKQKLRARFPLLYNVRNYFKRQSGNIKRKKNGLYSIIKINEAIENVDYIITLCKDEYILLKSYYKKFPEFLQIPYRNRGEFNNVEKKKRIILGNSGSYWNNHIDVIDRIPKSEIESDYNIDLLFSYGTADYYKQVIYSRIQQSNNVRLVETFMSIDEFEAYYNETLALVINSYRQHAMGNVFTALYRGTRVYLNKKNIMFSWLKKEGFIIYSVDEFYADYKNNEIVFSEVEAKHNIDTFKNLTTKYSVGDFQNKILNIIKK